MAFSLGHGVAALGGDIWPPVGSLVSFSTEIRNPERACPAKNMTCLSLSLSLSGERVRSEG